jgi:DNA-binding NarL/FixJ family response regulator
MTCMEKQPRHRSIESLPPRRREVAILIAKGYSDAEMAGLLGLAKNTVQSVRRSIYKDLGIISDTHILAAYVRDAMSRVDAAILNGESTPLAHLAFIEEMLP